jgi:hypothetical protein
MEHSSRTRFVTALVLVAVFGSGVLLGFAVDSNLGAETPDAVQAPTAEGEAAAEETPERRPAQYTLVAPNEAQLVRIESIVAEHRARTNALAEHNEETRALYRADFAAIVHDTREAIKGVLTPEQASEYQRLLDERYGRSEADGKN